MGSLSTQCGERVFDLCDLNTFDLKVQQEIESHWSRTIALGVDHGDFYASIYAFAIRRGDDVIAQAYSVASGGPSLVHDRSVICMGSHVIYAQGNQVACIDVVTGRLLWHVKADMATCWELYLLPQPPAIIVHGELSISKLWPDGKVAWEVSGRDIFTGPFEVREDTVVATDWDDDRYVIRIADGQIVTDRDA